MVQQPECNLTLRWESIQVISNDQIQDTYNADSYRKRESIRERSYDQWHQQSAYDVDLFHVALDYRSVVRLNGLNQLQDRGRRIGGEARVQRRFTDRKKNQIIEQLPTGQCCR
jgi:hypothetical protein